MKGLLCSLYSSLDFEIFKTKIREIFFFKTSRPGRLKDLSTLKANIILLRANLAWPNYWDFFNMTNKNIGKWEIHS